MIVYEIPLKRVAALEKVQQVSQRWLRVPGSFLNIGLYSTGSKFPLKALIEEYKVTKASVVLMLWDSGDGKNRLQVASYPGGEGGRNQVETQTL